jgi:hypothetical protein
MSALGTRALTLTIDGDDVTAEVSSAEIAAKEATTGFVSFADAAAGGSREYSLKLKFVQDPSTSTLWDQIWAHAGDTVACVLHPNGGTVDATHPVFTGNVIISEPDGTLLGGDADVSPTQRWVTEVEWVYTAKPVRTVT